MAEEVGTPTREREEYPTEKTETKKNMTPWEQHSAVISLPRFDYNAPSSLLQHSHCGFLITCTIKREKSATKEAMSILERYAGPFNSGNDSSENLEVNNAAKKRRISAEDNDGKYDGESLDDGKIPEGTCLNPGKAEKNIERVPGLSLVKLTRSGLLLFIFPRNTLHDTVDVVSKIIQSLESGSLIPPVWCHRIFPIQATCRLNEKELHAVVSMLVKKFVTDKQDQLGRPLKFAVGYNRRGIEEAKFLKENTNDSNAYSLLDRNKCFGVVASAVKDALEDSVVDLKSPEITVLIELLPLSGVPNGSLVVSVSVLSRNLVNTKPKLCIKALSSNTKEGTGDQ
ncbi:hypothetical protein L6164_001292 [Bauhinia variegata]|uniref:Uncharacterized protein n=1 Tax=Bauhinia variegata TaxID=167791 RepID=A0ACB9Q977_BAUVA|nr:hypothetical protein L6164_001292 [Bauhinia variegata]